MAATARWMRRWMRTLGSRSSCASGSGTAPKPTARCGVAATRIATLCLSPSLRLEPRPSLCESAATRAAVRFSFLLPPSVTGHMPSFASSF
eukprot:2226583-Prymnesium_polylepis.1